MTALSNLGNQLSANAASLPANLSALPASVISNMASIIAGVGGGVIGDVGEFLNMSYENLKLGLDTGNWGPFTQDIATFGASVVLTAAVVTGTVALAGLVSPAAAAAVAAAWVAYGIYDGLSNLIEFGQKVYNDWDYWRDKFKDNPLQALSDLFNGANDLISPLVLDLDGDGIELTALADSKLTSTSTLMVSGREPAGYWRTMGSWRGTQTAMVLLTI